MMCMNKNAKEASKVLQYLYSWPYIQMLIDNNSLQDEKLKITEPAAKHE